MYRVEVGGISGSHIRVLSNTILVCRPELTPTSTQFKRTPMNFFIRQNKARILAGEIIIVARRFARVKRLKIEE